MHGTLRLFPVVISPIVWNMCEHSLWIGIFQRATQGARILLTDNIQSGAAVASTVTSVYNNFKLILK